MRTRTTNPVDVTTPQQSLKKTLSASWAELAQDFKAMGLSPDLVKAHSSQLNRKRFHAQSRGRRLKEVKMEDLTPFLGLESFVAEAEMRSREPCHVPCPAMSVRRSSPPAFQPGRLRRSATHAAIAYFIWQCYQTKQSPCV